MLVVLESLRDEASRDTKWHQLAWTREVLQHIMTERDIEGAVFSRTEPKHKQMTLGDAVFGM